MPEPENSQAILDVLIVGAGFGGVATAIKLRERGIENFRVFEKASGVGGTWWHNSYPGAACDIASHLYCYSFEPNPNWSRKYSPQAEIQQYIEHCVEKYGIRQHIQLDTAVDSLHFKDELQFWQACLSSGETVQARHVVFCNGALHLPSYPDIPGREGFKGPAMHSAEWDHSVDFGGKRVAVIGSAASAIQLIPELAKVAARVDVYQRTPNYIAPRKDRAFSEKEKARFARWPLWHKLYRWSIFARGQVLQFAIIRNSGTSRLRDILQRHIISHIRASVKDSKTREQMIPDYPMGCKRMLIADNYYDAINRDNVNLITEGIAAIHADSIQTEDGDTHRADILVYATGFDLENYLLATQITGRNNLELNKLWADQPSAYKGAYIPGFPNLHLMSGPNTGVGTSSVVYMIEAQLLLIMQALEAAGSEQLLEVSEAANQAYNNTIGEALKNTVWAGDCNSWYKREDGEIATLYPFDVSTYRRDHKRLQKQDFTISPRLRSAAE
jgi:cation diffusion facilitator CzcD-associated flavoprotein CzcO